MHNEYARCPACTHQARKHDLEGCTLCECVLDQVVASEGPVLQQVMYP